MRIISGQFKGRTLSSFRADFIRPMTDRVKTSVFNTLYSQIGEVEGLRVLDLFSGTGSLGLEAYSRGASHVTAVDSHKKAVQIIKKNLQILKINSHFKIYQKNVFQFLSYYKGEKFNLVFADPPFKSHYGEKILNSSASSLALGKGSILVLEVSSQEKIPKEMDFARLLTQKSFGDKKVLFYSF